MFQKPNPAGDPLLLGLALSVLGFVLAAMKVSEDPAAVEPSKEFVPSTDLVPETELVPFTGVRRGPLIDLGDVALLDIAGAWPDGLQRAADFDGERKTCYHCDGSSPVNAINTRLLVFSSEPHYTYAEFRCLGKDCQGNFKVINCLDDALRLAVGVGAEMVVVGQIADVKIAEILDSFWATTREPDDATPLQREIHALALADAELAFATVDARLLNPDMA
jgi:hypothetical protein